MKVSELLYSDAEFYLSRKRDRLVDRPHVGYHTSIDVDGKRYAYVRDLADELGVKDSTVCDWLAGRNEGYRKYGITSIARI